MADSSKDQERSKHNKQIEKDRILLERRQRLAQKPNNIPEEVQTIEVLVFCLGEEKFGIGSENVRELCPLKQITRVPCVPDFVTGIINLRGKIFSIIDLKSLFGLPKKHFSDPGKVVIVGYGEMEVGLKVDDVEGVRQIPVSQIQQDLPVMSEIQQQYFCGITAERLTIINLEILLTDESIVVHETIGP
ncbi:MAG: chemotaxis protein CheW [Desulfomonilaceae bacterium]